MKRFVFCFTFAAIMLLTVGCSQNEMANAINTDGITRADMEGVYPNTSKDALPIAFPMLGELFELSSEFGISVSAINYSGVIDNSTLQKVRLLMQSLDSVFAKEYYILLQDEEIQLVSMLDPLLMLPCATEYVTERSCIVSCTNIPPDCVVTLHWNNSGAFVCANSPCYVTSNVISYSVSSDCITFSGRFVLNKEPNYTKIFNLFGHYYLNGEPNDLRAVGIVD